MCSCWHQALKITLLQIHFSVDLWRDRSWTCSMVYTELKPTGRKAIRLLSRAGRVWAGRLEASAGRWSKPRMCVLSVKKSCWRKQPVSYCRCVGPGSRFHSLLFQDGADVLAAFVALVARTWPPYSIISPNTAHPAGDIQHASRKNHRHIFADVISLGSNLLIFTKKLLGKCWFVQADFLDPHLPPVLASPRFGCHNNIHVSCMKVWADHQGLSEGEETGRISALWGRYRWKTLQSSSQPLKERSKTDTWEFCVTAAGSVFQVSKWPPWPSQSEKDLHMCHQQFEYIIVYLK